MVLKSFMSGMRRNSQFILGAALLMIGLGRVMGGCSQ